MNDLILVSLNEKQIQKAKEHLGKRKQMTHALLCGEYGQMIGSEKHCRKFFDAWKDIFKHLFINIQEVSEYELSRYDSDMNIVNRLIEKDGQINKAHLEKMCEDTKKKKGFLSRIFGSK